jgi:hypothetical protein
MAAQRALGETGIVAPHNVHFDDAVALLLQGLHACFLRLRPFFL